jgi:hypothetical protein
MLELFLTARPMGGVSVSNCASAGKILASGAEFDIMIADRHLADGDGVDCALDARWKYDCGTIVLSGSSVPEGGVPPGLDAWLVKPIERLNDTIQRIGKAPKSAS